MKQQGALLVPPGYLDGSLYNSPPSILLGFPSDSLVPIYRRRWKEAMWSKVSSLKKQHGGRDQD